MKVRRSARIALLCLAAFLHQASTSVVFAATVPSNACLYALDPTADRAFQIAGAQSVYTACGVVSESSASDGFEMEGAETLYLQNHAQVSVVGGAQLNGQTYLLDTISNKDVHVVQTSSPGDPLASIAPPTSGVVVSKSHAYFDMNSKPTSNTLSPGVYCGGLTIGNTNGTAFTMTPGVYIMAGGGLVLNSQAAVKGTGVTVYNTSSAGWGCSSSYSYTPITISGQVTATLSAPTAGSLAGILFFGNRTGCSTAGSCVDQINGGSTAILNGALYFKSDEIEITGSNASGYTMLVADKIYINGNSTFANNGDPFDGITVSVSPSTATLLAAQTQQFTVAVNNSANSAVTWTITPAGLGTISSSGLYTTPATVATQQTVTITATSQADTSKFGTATVTLTPVVTKTTPVITWAIPAAISYGTALSGAQLDASSPVAGTFAYTPAIGTVLAPGSQTLSVTFIPTNTTSYNAATASVPLTVNKATPVITWAAPAAISYGTVLSATQLDATASVAGTFTYSPAASTALAAGSQTLSVTFTPTNTTDYSTATATVALTVNKAVLTVTATNVSRSYGVSNPTLTSSFIGFVNGDTTSVVSGAASLATTATTSSSVGAYPITAAVGTLAAANYSFSFVNGTLTIAQASTTVTWTTPAAITYGTALGTAQLNATATVAGTFVYAPAAGTMLPAGLQTLTVTFTPNDTADYSTSTASVALTVNNSPISVTVTPPSVTLYGGQTQQYTASVTNSSDQTVFWMISPAGAGAINQAGLYTAPGSISTQQPVTITATSQADTTKSASAVVSLSPPQCASNGYGSEHVIVIDHTKIPNTDQTNFPFMFNTTDPVLKSTANGGQVANPNGYDIIFTSDPAGQHVLDFEMEKYDPVHGQVIAWVRIPTLSHTADTVLYLFYGNSSITASQQNPAGVWDSNFQAVYHLANVGAGTAADSTLYGNTGTNSGVASVPGEIGGGVSFTGPNAQIATNYIQSLVTAYTVEAWINTTSTNAGVIVGDRGIAASGHSLTFGLDGNKGCGWSSCGSWGGLSNPTGSLMFGDDSNSIFIGAESPTAVNDGTWHHVVGTWSASSGSSVTPSQFALYIDGTMVNNPGHINIFISDSSPLTGLDGTLLGTNAPDGGGWTYSGLMDEVRISTSVRSADWIAAEFINQSSPSAFYAFYPGYTTMVVPPTTTLYASQSQQFTAPGACGEAVTWSMPETANGSLTAGGLYTAPASNTTQQTIAVTATSQASGTVIGSATITLMPPPPPINLAAASPSPYQVGSSQGFVATLKDQYGAPESGVSVTFTVTGVNNSTGSAVTDNSGIASLAYIGPNSGHDTIATTATVNGQQLNSNTVSVSWTAPLPANAEGNVKLQAGTRLGISGLLGAFTDEVGTVVEPVAIGAAPNEFVVPAGATQLQLGVNDFYFSDNLGTGYVVQANGIVVTVPPTARPWYWVSGGLNQNYEYGTNGSEGTSPIVALTGLTQGELVSIVYQSGQVQAGSGWPLGNANGDLAFVTGTTQYQSAYFPTLYTTSTAYPVGQPIPLTAVVTDGSGSPMPSVPVTLDVLGANAHQYQTTADSTGTATFNYTGFNAGTDTVVARAYPLGKSSIASGQATITWVTFTAPPPSGSLTLTPNSIQPLPVGGQQVFTVLAKDASGAPVPNLAINLVLGGADSLLIGGTTDSTGHASINYRDGNPGIAYVEASAVIDGIAVFSNSVSVPWTLPGSTTPVTRGSGTLTISISAQSTVTLPNTLQLTGTATDSDMPAGSSPTVVWSMVSGPGIVTFATPQQATTTAAFSQAGDYVVQLSASDTVGNSGSIQFTITVNPILGTVQGWVGSPLYGSTVSGLVPITLAAGVSLQSGTLVYYPASNPNRITVLNSNTVGSGQIGTLDTTTLVNGSYWIQLRATDASGDSQYGLVQVTVAGSYKPGRVTATVTDLIVPATGLAINIQRSYDSLNAGSSSDFGYGWSLGLNVNLSVDSAGDVTFTLNGQRKTFSFQPLNPCTSYGGCLFSWAITPAWTPEPGLHGTLASSGAGCQGGWDFLVKDGSTWFCETGGQYSPPGYIYTDPNGTSYTIGAGGALQSIQDRSGNGLTITANGITSTTGLSVPFVRDAQNRITQITDPQGNIYAYGYDDSGNLSAVTYPNTAQPSTYTYDTNHRYLTGTDARTNPLPVTAYYTSTDTDPNGLPLSGRLQSVTNAAGETSYAYNLAANTTTVTYPDKGTATMVYDSYGNLLTSTDPLGNTTTNVYDANHNLISVTDPLGNTTTSTYDANGNKTSSTYPKTAASNNTTSTTAYNQYSEPTSTTDELGNVRTFNYDANYNPQSVTDASGTLASFLFNADSTLAAGAIGFNISASPALASQFTYDANGNMVSRTDALGRTTTYTYDSLGHKTATVAPTPTTLTGGPASTTTYQYDALGNLIQTAAPLGRTTGSTYDANGNKLSDTDARGNVTSYHYDALNRLTITTYPDKTTSSKTYDFRNNVLSSTDQAGNITQNAYDLAGRLTSVTRGYGTSTVSTISCAYDNAGHKISETDALGHTTSYTYDAAGRLTAVSGVKGNTAYGYDDAGNQTSRTDGNGNTTSFQYDARKRLIKTTYPDKTTVVNTYDGPGNLASVTDQNGNVVEYTYDAANQLKTVVQVNHPNPSKNTNLYGYDNLGNLTGLTDENLHTTVNGFDVFNESVSKLLPDATHTESRQYDSSGNLLSLTHFNGITTTYTYDALNRLLSRTTPGEAPVSFTYTATGKYLTSTAADGTVKYTYDALDRLATKATPEGTLSYTYDAAGHVESIVSSNPNGASVAYTYDELNRLGTVVDNRLPGQNTTTYTYDPASNVATVAYANGLQSNFTYDTLNRLTEMITPVSGYSYTLGATGNRTQAVEINGRTLNWNYDGINRLTNETISDDPSKSNGSVSYGLDPVGNRLSATSTLSGVSSGSFTYNADDQISSESYDANGNTLTAGGKIYTYDAENHMTSMTSGSTAVTLVYDAFGNRVAKTVNGVTTKYLVEDDVNPTGLPQVLEETVNGAVQRVYTYGLQRISEYQMVSGTWTASYYGYDGAGSVRQLTNSAGAVTDTYDYDAFGNKVNSTGTTPNAYMYRGEAFDSDLGLYYLRARYMNPLTGRFMSRDPNEGKAKVPATLHKYLYAFGDPVNRIDPRGREALVEYKVTMICGGTLYCGATITWTGIKIAAAWALIGTELGEVFDFSTNPEAPPPPVHDPSKEPGGGENPPEQPPISGPPEAGAP